MSLRTSIAEVIGDLLAVDKYSDVDEDTKGMVMQINEVTAPDDYGQNDNVLCRIPVQIRGESNARIIPFMGGSISAKFIPDDLYVDNITNVTITDKSPHGMTITFTGDVAIFAHDIVSGIEAVMDCEILEVTGLDGVVTVYNPEIAIALNACF